MSRLIVSTSTSCLDYLGMPSNVVTLPMNIHIGNTHYLDGKDINFNQLADSILNYSQGYPTTSAPTEPQLIDFFNHLADQGVTEVLVITMSRHLSPTYENIQLAQPLLAKRLKIYLYDSLTVSHGEAVLVQEASRLLEEGKLIFPQIILALDKIRQKMRYYITVDNLKGMIRTKRISAPAGFFANLLNIKPIVECDDNGRFLPYEKVRGFDNSLYRLVEIISTQIAGKQGQLYMLAYSQNPYLPKLSQTLAQFGHRNVPVVPIASVSMANIGVYAMGVLFVERVA